LLSGFWVIDFESFAFGHSDGSLSGFWAYGRVNFWVSCFWAFRYFAFGLLGD
jgi:hypothetical protein